MSEAVLDEAIEHIADGLAVDWRAFDQAPPARARDWAKSLRVLSDIVKLHRDAAADYDQTTLGTAAATDAAPTASLEVWGKYRMTNKVGEGSYGSVYRAWDSELERDVAIKILHRRVGDTRLRERLLQEGRALAKIQHNNVVRVLGIEAAGDRVGLCMEFVRGKTLADIVRGGKLSAAEAVLIGEDLCRALSAVHRAGFIHRDVKAKNVMRDDTGRIVLMDFGTGRSSEALNKNDRAGTPLYMAPEVIEEGQQSMRSDVYSLGVLLYYLVTGEYPVNARTIDELREAHARREHRWLSEVRPDLPIAFMQVVEKAIALDPEDRYQNASELLGALANLKIGPRPWVWRLARPVGAAATIVAGLTLLGAMTSTHFNVALQRSEFSTDTLWDWLAWGRRSSFMPFMVLLVGSLVSTLLYAFHRLVVSMFQSVHRYDLSLRRRAMQVAHRFRLDEAPVAAGASLLISATALVAAWWSFTPLLLAIAKYESTASTSELRLLSPEFLDYHNQYRQVFIGVVLLTVAVWYPVVRLVKRGQSLHWALWVAGSVVTCMALFCLHLPYRLLIYRNNFEAVRWADAYCLVIGERDNTLLLFCPDLDPPRNRTISRNDKSLVFLGTQDRLLTRFARAGVIHP